MRRAGFTPPFPAGCRVNGLGLRRQSRGKPRPTMTRAAQSIGIAAVLVQAKDEGAKAWYLRQVEVLDFPEGRRVLWLPVRAAAVGGA